MRTLRALVAAVAAICLLLVTALPASADFVVNDVVATEGQEILNVPVSEDATAGFWINATGGNNGTSCYASDGSPVTVTVVVKQDGSPTSDVTVTPASRQFSACGTAATQYVDLSSEVPGSYDVTVTVTDASGTTSNHYNLNQASFRLVVTEPTDATPPVITKSVTGTSGTNGWYTSNVTVAWTVTDPESAVTIDSGCGTQQLTTEGAALSSSCAAHSAGGTTSDSVALKIDKTGPSAVLSPSGTLGLNAWYTSTVEVTTAGADSVSGPPVCTGPQTFADETAGTTVNGSCQNDAGLSTPAAPIEIKIDRTGPTGVVLTPSGTPGTNGWFTSNVSVSTSGTDSLSGGVTCSAPQTLSTETTGTQVNGSCTNAAGLPTSAPTITVKIDTTSPTASLSITGGTLGAGGWYTTAVTVHTNGADTTSEPVTCTDPQTFSADSAGIEVNGSCANDAGLQQSAGPLTLSIDTTAPTNVVLTPTGTVGANGWYTSDVSVATTGVDGISGVSCAAVQTFNADAQSITVNGSCTNGAGLTTAASPITIKIDKTAPTNVALAPAGTLGANGWYTSDVTVSTSGEDAISGVSCTGPELFDYEGGSITVNGSCTNGAGLTTTASPITMKIDKTGPTDVLLTPSGTAGANGWFTSNVSISTTGTDTLSGGVTCTPPQPLSTETTGTQVNGSCTNGAGLTTAASPITMKIDKSAPIASIGLSGTLGTNGWYVSSVTATASGSDTVSGPVDCVPSTQTHSDDTLGATLSSICTNQAGLWSPTSANVKVDQTGPEAVAITGGPANGSEHYFGSVPAVPSGCTATDATSGFASCSVSGYSTAVGPHTMTARAYDDAGNLTTMTSTYTVMAWEKGGFYQPVDMGGVVNVVKNGSTVPLKFEAFAGSTELTNTNIVDYFVVDGIPCPGSSTATDDIEMVTSGGTVLRYDSTGGQFIQNWQTPKKAGVCYRVSAVFDDGGSISTLFRLK